MVLRRFMERFLMAVALVGVGAFGAMAEPSIAVLSGADEVIE